MQKRYALIRVRDATHEKLKELSTQTGVSQGVCIERLLAQASIYTLPPMDYFHLLDALRRIGVNLNQISKNANTFQTISEEDRTAYFQNAEELRQILSELRETVEGG